MSVSVTRNHVKSPTWTTFMESNITNRYYPMRNTNGRPKTRQEIQSRSNDNKMQITRKNAANKLFKDFTNNTTILGLSHYLKSRNILWLVAWLTCLAIGIAQSWNVAHDLFNNTGTQKILISNEVGLKFPSITVCSYNLLPDNYELFYRRFPQYQNLTTDPNMICQMNDTEEEEYEQTLRNNDNYLLTYLRTIEKEERLKLSIDIWSMVQKCIFVDQPCNVSDPDFVYSFNNPYYGNCITFNPGFDPEKAIIADIYTSRWTLGAVELSVILKVDSTGWLRVANQSPRIAILFHSPGTAPVLESSTVYDLRPGDNSEFTLKLNEIRFHKELSSGCVDATDLEYRKSSFYYFRKTPYLYSIEACMKTCLQQHTTSKCKKIDPIVPIQKWERKNNITTESPPISCDLDERNVNMRNCRCPLPCSFLQYTVNPDTTTLLDSCRTNKTKKQQKIRFTANFLTTIVEIVQEEQEYSLAQFYGVLGGNLSLSVGFCIISILELVELAWDLIAVWIIPSRSAQVLNRSSSTKSFSSFLPLTKISGVFKRFH